MNSQLPADFIQTFEEQPSSSAPPTQDRGQPHKIWSITIWQSSEDAIRHLLEANDHRFTRVAACIDEAPTTEGIHFHVAAVFNSAMRYSAVKAIFGDTSHVEWRSQKDLQNLFNYVLGQGNHADFKRIIYQKNAVATKKIKSGKKVEFYREWRKNPTLNYFYELIQQDEWVEFNTELKYIEREVNIMKRKSHKRKFPRTVVWVWGSTGAGKSRMAHELMEQWENKWFPYDHCGEVGTSTTAGQCFGLQGDEDMVLIDDVKTDKIQTQDLLKLTDQYPQPQDIKGAWAHYNPDMIVITCLNNVDALAGNKWQPSEIAQLKRRITYTIHVQAGTDEPYEWYNNKDQPIGAMSEQNTVQTLLLEVRNYLQQFAPGRIAKELTPPDSEMLPH